MEDFKIDYSQNTGFPFYVMGYEPKWVDCGMTDLGANYKYVGEQGASETSNVIIKTQDGDKFSWIAQTSSESQKLGDVNEDGKIDVTDVMSIVYHILGLSNPVFNATNADYDLNGEINVTDAMLVVDYILGKPVQPTQYYWYVGNADDPMPTSISPIVTDNTSVGWRLIGSSITDGQQIWDESNDIQISTERKVYQRIIINSDNVDLKFYDSLGNVVEGFVDNKTVNNGWTIFLLAYKSKTFSIITKIHTTAEYWYVGTAMPNSSNISTLGTLATTKPDQFNSTTEADEGEWCYFIYPKNWGYVTIHEDEARTVDEISGFEYLNDIIIENQAQLPDLYTLVSNYYIYRCSNGFGLNPFTLYLNSAAL